MSYLKNNCNSQYSKICVDNLFPSSKNVSGTRGKKLDVDSLYKCVTLDMEPNINFSSEILIEKREKRRKLKLTYYKHMLKYCYDRIEHADNDLSTDLIINIVSYVPECKEYNPLECLNYISDKLREQHFDTLILSRTSIFVTWKFIELKKEENTTINSQNVNSQSENDKNDKNIRHVHVN